MHFSRLFFLTLLIAALPAFPKEPTLQLAAPLASWDHGIPLGNGLCGGLLWGAGNTVNLSLDRGDLWDLRVPPPFTEPDWNYKTMEELAQSGNMKRIHQMFDDPYEQVAYPTKLPAGRLVLSFPPGEAVTSFSLDARKAEAEAVLGTRQLRVFFSATEPVALVRITGPAPRVALNSPSGVDKLGYPAALRGDETVQGIRSVWMLQTAADGLRYAVVVSYPLAAGNLENEATTFAITIVSNRDLSRQGGADPVALGKQRNAQALQKGYESLFAAHVSWWKQFWSISDVQVPDAGVQRQYVLDKYFYGSASRPGAPPMPLQGVWTADEGGLPPWKGDYHNDLNTQMTYLAAPEAGLFAAEQSFLDFNWKLLPRYERFAQTFYGVPGAIVPGVEALDGAPLGGWPQYSLSPTMSAWVAQSFYLHWRYTMDPVFLRTRAYPFLERAGTALLALMRPGPGGKLRLPLSSSPEIFDNSRKAWLPANSNFDLALLRWLYAALAEMAHALNNAPAARHWQDTLAKLEPFDVQHGVLTVARGIPLPESHRHLSNLMAIHPLGLITIEGSAADRALVNGSIDDFIAKGPRAWMGYTYSWMSCVLARAGRGDEALRNLQDYLRGFIFPNGFHVNGDQSGTGLSDAHYHPFTLEGNFLAMQAVQEMLLQSWGGTVRVFPATPGAWGDVSFDRLRAEGGFLVSARRHAGKTTSVSVRASVDGLLRLKNPFAAKDQIRWSRALPKAAIIELRLKSGETLEGRAEDLR